MKKVTLFSLILIFMIAVRAKAQSADWFTQVNDKMGLVLTPDIVFTFTIADVNNDDYPDIVYLNTPAGTDLYHTLKPFKVLLNVADTAVANTAGRRYIDVTAESQINLLAPDSGYNANCFTFADLNNDGNLDLVTASFYYKIEQYPYPNNRCEVFLGDGTGKFTWEPNSGLDAIGLVNARTISALDYDLDGNLDLYVATAFKDYTNNVFDHGYLLKGRGDGTFEDVTKGSGLDAFVEPDYSASVMDYNNDCYPDIFTAPYCRTGGKVFRNDGNGHFTNVADEVGYDLYKMGNGQHACTFTTTPEDVNNDGYMDLFISEVHGGNAAGEFHSTIAINKGPDHNYGFDINPGFLPPTASYHRGDYDGAFMDFENDGLIDLVMTQGQYMPATDRTYFYQQQADHSFKDVTAALGLIVPEMKNSSVVEPLDFDLDGDDDLLLDPVGGANLYMWQNNIGNKHNWIAVKLKPVGNKINKSAIGAKIYVYCDGKMHLRTITAGRGMQSGQQPFILNFGLGDAAKVDSIIVKWPDNNCSVTKVDDPAINQMITISNDPNGIDKVDPALLAVKVFPNPTHEYLVIQRPALVGQMVALTLTDISGRTIPVAYERSDTDKLILNLSSYPDGIYMIALTLKDGQVVVRKVVKD